MTAKSSLPSRIIVGKILAAVGAFFLVVSFALAVLQPPFQSLGEFVVAFDQTQLNWLNTPPAGGGARMLWDAIAVPLLIRPDWLIPTMLGLVCVGLAAQLTWGKPKS